MQTEDGAVLSQYNEDGSENTWKKLDPIGIIQVTLVPKINLLPQHVLQIDKAAGNQFIRRFARGLMKWSAEGIGQTEYMNCIVTKHFRYYASAYGHTWITPHDYEFYPTAKDRPK